MATRRGIWLLFTFLATIGLALAQSVRDQSPISSSRIREANRAAERQGAPWPDLAVGGRGTQIHVTGNFRNSDLTIVTYLTYPREKLLQVGRELAKRLGGRVDFITAHGMRLHMVDLEFNREIRFEGNHSHAEIDIGQAVAFLASTDLPQPIGVAIFPRDARSVVLDGRKLERTTVFAPKEIAASSVVTFDDDRRWYRLIPFVAMLAFMCVALLVAISATAKRLRGKIAPPATANLSPPLKDLSEAQSRYDKTRKWSWLIRILPFAALLMPASFDEVPRWLSPSAFGFVLAPSIVLATVQVALTLVWSNRERVRRRKSGEAAVENPLSAIWILFVGMLMMLGVMLVIRAHPEWLAHLSPAVRRVFIFGLAFSPLVTFLIVQGRRAARLRTRLAPGDHIYDTTMRFATLTGAKVRRVVILQSMAANAAATLTGTVLVTSRARDAMPQAELDAVLAHEVGHLRAKHVPKLLIASLAGLIVLNGVVIWALDPVLERSADPTIRAIAASPLVPLLIMSAMNAALAPKRKRAEYEADRTALEITGDYATLARSLARIHLLNGSPHTLAGADEFLASHPSLTKRLARLRDAAVSLGMPVRDDVIDDLMRAGPTAPPVIAEEPAGRGC